MIIYNCATHFSFGFQDTNLGYFKESGAYAFIHPCISFHSKLLFLSFVFLVFYIIGYFCNT
ncbi:Uncharacterised protein [Bacteroides thetaiotaomicron]|uniref:Uncharacterized protein n=1 Tax=Bacteroides thetaiotaomicron TaxID=818 RepID=A0A174U713_BACT4|nr:Uncharacterised protein [Bacteroides thetaiotaomicron]